MFFSQDFTCHIIALMNMSKASRAKHEQDASAWSLMTQESDLLSSFYVFDSRRKVK